MAEEIIGLNSPEDGDTGIQTPETEPNVPPAQDDQGTETTQATPNEGDTIATLRAKLDAEQAKARFYQSIASQPERNPIQRQPQEYHQPQMQQPQDPYGFGDDDVLTGAQVKALMQSMAQEQLLSVSEITRESINRTNEVAARASYQDFDEVLGFAKDLVQKDQNLLVQLSTASNIAEAAYFLGKTHPDYQKKNAEKIAQSITEQIQKGIKTPTTLSAGGGTQTLGSTALDRAKSFKDSDIESILARARRGEIVKI